MQENYEDGTKGEIKIVDWKDLGEEIKKSLSKANVKSVTVSNTIGLKPVKITEEKESLMEQILKEESDRY